MLTVALSVPWGVEWTLLALIPPPRCGTLELWFQAGDWHHETWARTKTSQELKLFLVLGTSMQHRISRNCSYSSSVLWAMTSFSTHCRYHPHLRSDMEPGSCASQQHESGDGLGLDQHLPTSSEKRDRPVKINGYWLFYLQSNLVISIRTIYRRHCKVVACQPWEKSFPQTLISSLIFFLSRIFHRNS